MKKTYKFQSTMARDQYGQWHHDLGRHPRKELLNRLCRKKAQRMFIDTKDGTSKHIGYVIAGLWLTLFRVEEWS